MQQTAERRMPVLGTAAQYQRALDKAATKRPLECVAWIAPGAWRVRGDTDTYDVKLTSDGLACSCRASLNGMPCWHIAAVHLAKCSAEAFRADPLREQQDRHPTALPPERSRPRVSFDEGDAPSVADILAGR